MEEIIKMNTLEATSKKIKVTKRVLSKKTSLILALSVTLFAMVVEFAYSYITNSIMLRSDGVHMLSHALALTIAFGAIIYAKKQTDLAKAKKIEALAAFTNALLIFGFVFWIFYESIIKFSSNETILTDQLFWVALFGLAVNLLTAAFLVLGGIEDINTKGAFLHMLADTFSSVAILLGALITDFFNYYWLDPLLSIIIGLVILKWGVELVKESKAILID